MSQHHVITGGAGFIGYHLACALAGRGDTVDVVDNYSSPGSMERAVDLLGYHGSNVRIRQFDLVESAIPEDLIPGGATLWHLASPAAPALYKRFPVHTLRLGGAVLDALLTQTVRAGGRAVFASSSEVYGQPERWALHEGYRGSVSCDGPRSCYDEAKRYGEAVCAAYRIALDVRVVRIFNTYGPRLTDSRLVPSLIRSARTGRPFYVHGDGHQTRTLSYVDDTIAGLLAVYDAPSISGPVNVGSDLDPEVSVLELIDVVLGLPGAIAFPVLNVPPQDEDDPRSRFPVLDRLRELGWEPRVRMRDGLRRMLEWQLGR